MLLLDDAGSPIVPACWTAIFALSCARVRCHLATEDVQLILVILDGQVLHHGDTRMLDYNAFVTINIILKAIHCPNATISIPNVTFIGITKR